MAMETNKPEAKHFTIRDAGPEDAAFLAKCVMAGMHYYDFEPIKPEMEGFYQSLVDCERRTDLLDTLAVVPEYRHRGIGRALLEDGIRLGKSKGFDLITLVVDSDMPDLVRLYKSVGFRSHDHRRIFGVDFLRMAYRK